MKVHRFTATFMAFLALFAIAACGPKPEPEPPPPPQPTEEELRQAHEQKIMPYREVAQKFNNAVWELDPELFQEAVTKDTYDMFLKRTQLEMELADEEGEPTAETFLKKQADYKIAYGIKDVDVETGIADVEGQIEGNVEFETQLKFVEEDGMIKIDHTEVLSKAIQDLEAAIDKKKELEAKAQKMRTIIADYNVALTENNAEMLQGLVTATTVDAAVKYMQMKPKKEGGHKKADWAFYVKFKNKKIEKVEVKDVDPVNMTATVTCTPVQPKKLKKGEEPPGPKDKVYRFTTENGNLLLDMSQKYEDKIKEMEEAEAEKKGKKKGK